MDQSAGDVDHRGPSSIIMGKLSAPAAACLDAEWHTLASHIQGTGGTPKACGGLPSVDPQPQVVVVGRSMVGVLLVVVLLVVVVVVVLVLVMVVVVVVVVLVVVVVVVVLVVVKVVVGQEVMCGISWFPDKSDKSLGRRLEGRCLVVVVVEA